MSSNLDSLVEAITELVISELQGTAASPVSRAPSSALISSQAVEGPSPGGASILVAPGPGAVDSATWKCFSEAGSVSFSGLAWKGFCEKRLSARAPSWKIEPSSYDMAKLVRGYKALVLAGSDLSVLSGIYNLGSPSISPVASAVASIASGIPVFMHDSHLEQLRRHSSRLSSGFVRRFEELYRVTQSFGVEVGGDAAMSDFLVRIARSGAETNSPTGARASGRDVVTVEDVEAVRGSGGGELRVAMGAIVTPLARQRAFEWGVEIVFQ